MPPPQPSPAEEQAGAGTVVPMPVPVPPAPGGLTTAEVAARRARDGPNAMPPPARVPGWRRLLAELTHFFAVMLWVAALLALVAGLPALAVAIVVVVVVNGVFAFAQEERAERASERLRDLLPTRVTVVRDGGRLEVGASDLVVDDEVVLAPGDRIAADLEVDEAHALRLDESTLTGESRAVPAEPGARLWAGTFVVGGEGTARVVGTGARTRLAGIARLTATARPPRSPLAMELHRVVRTIAGIAVGVGVGFFALATLLGTPASDGFLFAVGVTVALVPEGLLPTVTLSLAVGAQRMASRHALVRHLEAVETLGSTTFVCTDKTGTLTCNQMAVVEAWTAFGGVRLVGRGYEPVAEVTGSAAAVAAAGRAATSAVASTSGEVAQVDGTWVARGDPMEAALDVFARRLGQPGGGGRARARRRYAFDATRRRSSVLVGDALEVLGAPDAVLPRCREVTRRDGEADGADAAEAAVARMAGAGLRVLAVASRPASQVPDSMDPDVVEDDLELLALLGLEDPPRPGVAATVERCRRAGVRVAMITGDHPATAAAIARETGLLGPAERVLVGDELPDDDVVLGALLDVDGVVVSRVDPAQKLRITKALQQRGHVVAMTGDGVNDGPALREADIGVAMGRSGTDVAREAADLVLLDDEFATIVAAIEQGRATFTNIRRFLTYHLTDNVAELTPFVVWALSGGRFPLALGVLQILCLDIGTDLLPALALGAEAPDERSVDRPPTGRHLVDRSLLGRVFGVLGPVEAGMAMAAFVVAFLAAGWRPGDPFPGGEAALAASGAAFAAIVVGQAANAFACRSATVWPGRLGWTSNRLLVGAVAAELAALGLFLFVPPVAALLDQAPPPGVAWLVVLATAPALLAVDAAHKALRRASPRPRAAKMGG